MSSPVNFTRQRASSSSSSSSSSTQYNNVSASAPPNACRTHYPVPTKGSSSLRREMMKDADGGGMRKCRGLLDTSAICTTSSSQASDEALHRFEHHHSLLTASNFIRRNQQLSAAKIGKLSCTICQRKAACLCHDCASCRVDFYRKRSVQNELTRKRDAIARDIEAVLCDQINIEQVMMTTRQSVVQLKIRIKAKLDAIMERRKHLAEVNERLQRTRRTINDLERFCQQHEKVLAKAPLLNGKRVELEQCKRQFFQQQHEMVLELFDEVYPLVRQEKKCGECVCVGQLQFDRRIPEQIADASKSTKDGQTLLTPAVDESPQPSIHYSINGFCLKDCGEYGLKCWPKCGNVANTTTLATLNSSRDSSLAVHSTLTALTYGVQLVTVLQFFFDLLLPCKVSLRELSLSDRVSQHSLSIVIAKLNILVVFLCLSQGIDPSVIDARRPFANLMILYEQIACRAEQRMISHPYMIPNKLLECIKSDFEKINLAEQEPIQVADDGWCLVRDTDIEILKNAPSY